MRTLNRATPSLRLILGVHGVAALCLAALAFSNVGFFTATVRYPFGCFAQLGLTGRFFLFYLYASMLSTIFLWTAAYKQESDMILKRRILVITTGLLLFLPSMVDFFPSLGITLYPFGWIFGLLFLFFMSHASFSTNITQFYILVNSIFRRILTILIICLPWSLVSYLFFSWQRNHFWRFLPLFATLSFILLIPYVKYGIPWIERILFKKEFEFNKILQVFLDEIVLLKNINKLAHYIQHMLRKTLNTPNILLIIREHRSDDYQIWVLQNTYIDCPREIIDFLPWLKQHSRVLLYPDVQSDPVFKSIRPAALNAFSSMGAQIFVPLVHGSELLGVIVVGEKLNFDIFKPTEITFLTKLKSIATVALNNSYLYEHIRQLSRALWEGNVNLNEKVKEKTEELEVALAQMKKLNEEQANFFTMASHNLRTPLTSIKAAATLLWGDTPTVEKNDLGAVLHNNIRRLEMLIRYTIEVVKMENGKLEFMDGSIFLLSSMQRDSGSNQADQSQPDDNV